MQYKALWHRGVLLLEGKDALEVQSFFRAKCVCRIKNVVRVNLYKLTYTKKGKKSLKTKGEQLRYNLFIN